MTGYGVYISGCLNCPFLRNENKIHYCYLDDDCEISSDDLREVVLMLNKKYPTKCPLHKHNVVAFSLEV